MKAFSYILMLLLGAAWFAGTESARACSCQWRGAFLEVAKDAPLIVHGRVLRHNPGASPTMDLLALDTLVGGMLDSGMRIQMGDGAACRPTMTDFEPGSEWILALNGPGSKPGNGLALSHCGAFWLRVEHGEAVGQIEGTSTKTQRMPLQALKNRLRYPQFDEHFSAEIEAGKSYHRSFGGHFELLLEPMSSGWMIKVRELGHEEDLSRLTPPFHSLPNPREIEGWHLLKNPTECASRPYQADSAPSSPRTFIFSPEVGNPIAGPAAKQSVAAEEVEQVKHFGRGMLDIETFELRPEANGCPTITRMRFSVRLTGGY